MTPQDFNAPLAALGLSQIEASRLFGCDKRTVRRWQLGDVTVPLVVASLLKLMLNETTAAKLLATARGIHH